MQYLPLFLLMLAALIAAWFYLQRAKTRDAGTTTVEHVDTPAEPTTPATATPTATATPSDRAE